MEIEKKKLIEVNRPHRNDSPDESYQSSESRDVVNIRFILSVNLKVNDFKKCF